MRIVIGQDWLDYEHVPSPAQARALVESGRGVLAHVLEDQLLRAWRRWEVRAASRFGINATYL